MNGVKTDLPESLAKLVHVLSTTARRNHYDVGCTKIKSLFGNALLRFRSAAQELIQDLNKTVAQFGDRCVLAHIDARQSFGKLGLVAGCQHPMGAVIGKSFADK